MSTDIIEKTPAMMAYDNAREQARLIIRREREAKFEGYSILRKRWNRALAAINPTALERSLDKLAEFIKDDLPR